MKFNPKKFTIEFDDFDQHIGDLPSSAAVNEVGDLFEPTYGLFLATKHHRDDLDAQ